MPPAAIPRNEAARLASLMSCNVLDTPDDPIFDDITQMAAEMLDVPICAVSLVDEARQWFKSRHGLDAIETPRDMAFCAYAILRDETLVIEDATRDERTCDNPLVTGEMGIRFYAGHPLILDDGSAVGTLCVIDTKPRSILGKELVVLQRLAGQVTQLLHLYRESNKARLSQNDAKSLRNALNVHTLFSIANREGKIIDVNEGFCKISGYSREELLDQDHRLLNSGHHPKSFWKGMWRTLQSGTPWRADVCNRAKNGSLYWVDSTNIPQFDEQGKISHYVSLRFDITEKKKAEKQNEQLVAALNSSNDCLFLFDAKTLEFVYTNHGAKEQIGYTDIELARMTPVDIKPDYDDASFAEAIAPLYEDPGTSIVFRTRHQHKDGHCTPVEISLQLMEGLGDHGLFIAAVRDITEQLEHEREIHDSNKRFALAIEGSRDAIIDWDVVNDTIYYSPRWNELLEREGIELESSVSILFEHVVSLDVHRVEHELDDFVRSGAEHLECEFRMTSSSGRVVWVLLRAAAQRGDNGRAQRVSGSVADISTIKAVEEEMRKLVQQDQLTGLASRSKLLERLGLAIARSERTGKHCAVLFFDFDRFKAVNDSLGHDVGDDLLRSIADRLSSNIRDVDTAARFGGDEFVVLMEDLQDASAARKVADKLLDVCAEPHDVRGHRLVSTASIGVVTTARSIRGSAELLRDADAAMYQAKANGRGCVVEFDQAMHNASMERLAIEEEMREAIKLDQFTVHYQPIVDLESGKPIGAEALARWTHPERGPISPGVFIPIAEESNLMQALGDCILLKVCAQIKAWKDDRVISPGFTLSVNLSKAQLISPEFPEHVSRVVQACGIQPSDLKLEVTETTIVDNRAGVVDALKQLRAMGFIVMMDDFGTGHSSLSGLHTLPIDELKIDQSFIRHKDIARELVAITSSIVTLANHLSLKTVGEGIEDLSHVAILQDMGCDYGQGYLFSKPLPACEFAQWMSSHKQREAA